MRRRQAPKRVILPDPLLGSRTIAKFTNSVMIGGKKSIAEKIVYAAVWKLVLHIRKKDSDDRSSVSDRSSSLSMSDIKFDEKTTQIALDAFDQVLENIKPTVEVRSRRVGGSTYQVPVEVRASRQTALAMRWLIEYANKRGEKTMVIRLGNELVDAYNQRGGSIKKREDVHKMAKANQAFAHYKW